MFVELTLEDGRKFFLNMDKVITMVRGANVTEIEISPDCGFEVLESPDTIIQMMHNLER